MLLPVQRLPVPTPILPLLLLLLLLLTHYPRQSLTPLHVAVRCRERRLVAACLAAGAYPDEKPDRHGRTALHHAVLGDMCAVAEDLVAAGASPDAAAADGSTPLHVCAGAGALRTLEYLLQHCGADGLSLPDNDGNTPLHRAVGHGHAACSSALLAAGADVAAKTGAGTTPLHLASGQGRIDIVRQCLGAGATAPRVLGAADGQGATALAIAAREKREEACLVLLEAGADTKGRDERGRTALWHAASHGLTPVVQRMLDGEPKLANVTDKTHRGPLGMAAAGCHLDSVDALLKAGANVCQKDKGKATPVALAASSGTVMSAALVRTLLKAGGEANVRDVDGAFGAVAVVVAVAVAVSPHRLSPRPHS